MSEVALADECDTSRLVPENIKSVQPGGGVCYRLELAWGRWRRWYLRTFRKAYVSRMAAAMQGDPSGAPHELLDPRDLKYCSNQCTAHWLPADDPFRWRDQLPLTRWGLAEAQIMGWPLVGTIAILIWLGQPWSWLATGPAVVLGLILYFFRDPRREIPSDPAAIVSPADGTITEIEELEHYDFLEGPAVRIGIFLSIFNVHVNRSPRAGRVVAMHYKPGEFLDARDPESAIRNEFLWLGVEEVDQPHRRLAVRAISGLIARRIVCRLRLGDTLKRGEKFGMIKLGSRTELILPRDQVDIEIAAGQKVKAGSTVLASYRDSDT